MKYTHSFFQVLFAIGIIMVCMEVVKCNVALGSANFVAYKIQYVSTINNNLYAIWHSTNVIRLYNSSFSTNRILANFSALSPVNIGLKLMTSISSSYSENIMAGIRGNTLCWFNRTSNNSFCDLTTIPSNTSKIQFTEKQNIVVVCMNTTFACLIIDLNSLNNNKTVSYLNVIDKVNDLKFNIHNQKIYGVLNNGQVIFIDLDINSINYRKIQYTNIPPLSSGNSLQVLALTKQRKIIISDTNCNLIQYDLYANPPTPKILNTSLTNFKSFIQFKQTIIGITSIGTVQQFNTLTNNSLSQKTNLLMSGIICDKIINDSGLKILIYKYNQYQIDQVYIDQLEECNNTNCITCYQVNNINYCTECKIRYFSDFNYVCQKCKTNCLTCINTTIQGCTSCDIGYEMTNQTIGCVSICLNNQTRINGICITSCAQNCLTCVNTTLSGCTSCNIGYEINNSSKSCVFILDSNQKQINKTETNFCFDGFYFDFVTNSCLSCEQQCQTCKSAQNCTSFRFYYDIDSNGQAKVPTLLETIVKFFYFPNINLFTNSFSFAVLVADRLRFYDYNKKKNGKLMSKFFQIIHYIQSQKYLPALTNTIQNDVQQILPDWSKVFKKYQIYTIPKYYLRQRIDGTIMHNFQVFFTITLPINVLLFLFFRFFFYCFWNFKISYYLRSFSFGGAILVSLIQPNIQLGSYLAMNQMISQSSSLNSQMKVTIIVWILVFFFIVLYSCSWYFICYYFYERLSKYFTQSCYRLSCSFWWLTLEIGVKNILLGFIHSGLYNYYSVQMLLLCLLELTSLIYSIYIWKQYDCFKSHLAHFSRILTSALVIIFQITLYLDQWQDIVLIDLFDQIQYKLVVLIGINCLFYTISTIIVSICQQKQQQKCQNQQKQQLNNQQAINNQYEQYQKYIDITIKQCLMEKYQRKKSFIKANYQIDYKINEIFKKCYKYQNINTLYQHYDKSLQSYQKNIQKNKTISKTQISYKLKKQKDIQNKRNQLKINYRIQKQLQNQNYQQEIQISFGKSKNNYLFNQNKLQIKKSKFQKEKISNFKEIQNDKTLKITTIINQNNEVEYQ